jgi:hypothetical protein
MVVANTDLFGLEARRSAHRFHGLKGTRHAKERIGGQVLRGRRLLTALYKVPNKSNGYIPVSGRGGNKFGLLHELLVWSLGLTSPPSMQISHLCGRPGCLEASHVCLKTPDDNNARKGYKSIVSLARN